jgi:hypothetical protein
LSVSGGGGPGLPGAPGGFKVLTSSPVVGAPDAVTDGSLFVDEADGPSYGPNRFVQGQPTTPLITTTIGGPDNYGFVGSFDPSAYVPLGSEGLWLVRISGMVDGTSGLLRPLAGAGGPMDYLFLINTDQDAFTNPAIAIGDTSTGPLTPIPLDVRGTYFAIDGMPGSPLAQLNSAETWGTVIPSSLPADVAVEFNGERVDLAILPGQIIDLTSLLSSCVADFTGDGQLNFFDVSAFLAAYQVSNPQADMNNDGIFNFFDISTYIQIFSQGCP